MFTGQPTICPGRPQSGSPKLPAPQHDTFTGARHSCGIAYNANIFLFDHWLMSYPPQPTSITCDCKSPQVPSLEKTTASLAIVPL